MRIEGSANRELKFFVQYSRYRAADSVKEVDRLLFYNTRIVEQGDPMVIHVILSLKLSTKCRKNSSSLLFADRRKTW